VPRCGGAFSRSGDIVSVLVFVVLTIALFAVFGIVARAVERL
jgi:hypothetical protein